MAGQVVESMAAGLHPEEFTDTFQQQMRELVEAKLEGGEAFTAEEVAPRLDDTDDVSDLLAKLEGQRAASPRGTRRSRARSDAAPAAAT